MATVSELSERQQQCRDSEQSEATMSEGPLSRRAFLGTAATVVGLSVAGCQDSVQESVEEASESAGGSGSDFDGREPRWQFEATGWAGSPVIADGTLYVGEVFGGENGSLYALSTADGTEQWEYSTGHSMYTPTPHGEAIYAGGDDGAYSLATADGAENWHAPLPDATSVQGLVVGDDSVYVGSIASELYSLSQADGSVQWEFFAEQTNFYRPAVADGTVYTGCNQGSYVHDDDEWGKVYAVDATEGTELWQFETDRAIECPTNVVDNTVYVDQWALSAEDGSRLWRAPTGRVRAKPTVVDDSVYLGSEDGTVYALDAADGSIRWEFETGSNVTSSPEVVDETVYVGSEDGNLYALDAETGDEGWRATLGSEIYTSPAVSEDTVYVGATDHIVYAIPRDA